jgi:hypothetical protein
MTLPQSTQAATGAGVRIALIDSGVNAQHSHVGFVAGGIGFSTSPDGQLVKSADYSDRLGHGTALAGVLRAKAPQAEIFAVKVFAERLQTSMAVLEAAIRWAIKHHLHLVNLSLGTANPDHRHRFLDLVAAANAQGTIIVASSPPGRSDVFPATLPSVIGVAGDDRCAWGEHLHINNDPIPFRAHPHPRPLPGPAQARNFRGDSFSSAHISALLALLLEHRTGITVAEAREFLVQTAAVK